MSQPCCLVCRKVSSGSEGTSASVFDLPSQWACKTVLAHLPPLPPIKDLTERMPDDQLFFLLKMLSALCLYFSFFYLLVQFQFSPKPDLAQRALQHVSETTQDQALVTQSPRRQGGVMVSLVVFVRKVNSQEEGAVRVAASSLQPCWPDGTVPHRLFPPLSTGWEAVFWVKIRNSWLVLKYLWAISANITR